MQVVDPATEEIVGVFEPLPSLSDEQQRRRRQQQRQAALRLGEPQPSSQQTMVFPGSALKIRYVTTGNVSQPVNGWSASFNSTPARTSRVE